MFNGDSIVNGNQSKAKWFYKYSLIWGSLSSSIIFLFIFFGVRTSSIFALKDLVIYMMAIVILPSLIKSRNGIISTCLFAFFLWYIYLNFVLLNPSYNAPINNIRQILSPLIVLFFYSQLELNREASVSVLRLLCYSIVSIFVFGIVEQIVGLWSIMNLSVFFQLKGISTDENGLSYMFYEPLFGGRARMTSTFLDPISLGHFFSSAAIIFYNIRNKTNLYKITFVVCLVGMFLALSKGAIFQFFIAVIILNPRINIILRSIFVSVPFIFVQMIDSQGIAIHVSSFINSIDSISLFGYGLGNAGNYAAMFAENTFIIQKLKIGDTYIGSLIGQIGLFGTVFWIFLGVWVVWSSSNLKQHVAIPLMIFISIFTVSILSENTMNITSFLLPALMIGLSTNLSRNGLFDCEDMDAGSQRSVAGNLLSKTV